MKEKLTSTKNLKRVLGFWDLMAIAAGSIIGSGIMSLTGWGIERTGRSVFIAFLIGGLIILLARSPQIFLNSVARYRGGDYTMVGTFLGPRWTGTYSMISLLTSVTLSMYALSFADYAMPFLPSFTRNAIALGILTILFVINVFGVNIFAKIQNLAVALLVISLTIFTVVGLTKLEPNYFEQASWMTGGFYGLWRASVLMSYTCDGAQYITALSGEAKNPTKDIPRVMLISTLGIAVFYGLMGIVAAGVLPVEQVAGKPLTLVAETILSKPLYYIFVIGGAWMALLTTLNSAIATCTKPLMQACSDGWYPRSLARLHPKFRTPIILLGIYYVIGFVPIMTNIDIGVIGDITITVGSITKAMIVLCLLRLPKVLPEAWKKSDFYISNTMLMVIVLLDLGVIVFSGITSAIELPIPLLLANLAVVAFAFIFGGVRYKSGKVNVEVSYELPDSETLSVNSTAHTKH
ncbi:amino acid/polyamine/organocation transporter, APC superfamily (TC 2.A.3) [Dethiosulfatibacter aminovorans DSM 17477]|uniref:Amino acid/polyamine/organocation transporter, APC superfamily (TC 2.A.3) n=1 Tax=Dethiosulfatibacter aminovorans DSM 17477 TaxID=1121476 RepID=A0A1M6I861_9FIRM|nr:APC family permease [Dethiosulfatibacter aminovorans]SHJ30660.1 amino acid/polyamine/organocation transporter, APC superfamily (TC 2.A.3) [Dethiosulfatibacter aminovorans DSM 17477]